MNRILIPLMFVLMFLIVSCGGDTGNTGDTADTGDTGNTGNTGNTGDTGNTGVTCTGSDKFCHSHDGLNWSDASSAEMTWDDAVTYCDDLGGRLPTISELRTLIQNCPATETGGECKVTDSCLSYLDCWKDLCFGCEPDASGKYSFLEDILKFSSSSEQAGSTDLVWRVNFYQGSVINGYKDDKASVRCVKKP